MSNTSIVITNDSKKVWVQYVKGATVALIVSLVGILLFALLLKFVSISEGVIGPVNQVIKAISILVGTKVALKRTTNLGWLKGAILGLFYTLLAYLIFSFLSSSIVFDTTTLIDVMFGMVMGAICGIIVVNSKK